ncbi:MAG: hypothetical protein AAGB93_09085 [Planctomycetota bacterium]
MTPPLSTAWALPAAVVIALSVLVFAGSRTLRFGVQRNLLLYVAASLITTAVVILDGEVGRLIDTSSP